MTNDQARVIASQLIVEMGQDNGCRFAYTHDQLNRLTEAVRRLLSQGCQFTSEERELLNGDVDECRQYFAQRSYSGYGELHEVLSEIFNGRVR